jgi:hypothetical protein
MITLNREFDEWLLKSLNVPEDILRKSGVNLENLSKSKKDHLVPVKKIVNRNGKAVQTTVYVNPNKEKEHDGQKHAQQKASNEVHGGSKMSKQEAKNMVKALKEKHGTQGVVELAEKNGLEWSRNPDYFPHDYMRCAMALSSHFQKGGKLSEKVSNDSTDVKSDVPKTEPKLTVPAKVEKPDIKFLSAETEQEADKIGENLNSSDIRSGLSKADRKMVKYYTRDDYMVINEYLRTGKVRKDLDEFDMESSDEIKDYVKTIDSLIDSNNLQENVMLYRGSDKKAIGDAMFNDLENGNFDKYLGAEIQDKAFVSTSIAKKRAFKGDIQFSIEAPKGTKAAYIRSLSVSRSEHEVLLPRDTKFKIKGIEKGESGYHITLEIAANSEPKKTEQKAVKKTPEQHSKEIKQLVKDSGLQAKVFEDDTFDGGVTFSTTDKATADKLAAEGKKAGYSTGVDQHRGQFLIDINPNNNAEDPKLTVPKKEPDKKEKPKPEPKKKVEKDEDYYNSIIQEYMKESNHSDVGSGDEVVVEYFASSGHTYLISMMPSDSGIHVSTSKETQSSSHDQEFNVKTLKTKKAIEKYFNDIQNR